MQFLEISYIYLGTKIEINEYFKNETKYPVVKYLHLYSFSVI